ncbi:adenylate kinase [Synergistales bacterium]|nr:adenylate kinase [Synergistales bacterium]
MRMVLLGAPGSGKGTQADLLKDKYACAHISTGDIFRRNLLAKTELGVKAGEFMNRGELVPDEIVIGMVKDRLRESDATGFLMDGFPRTIPQAEAFGVMLEELKTPLDAVVLLDIDEEILVGRLTNRRTCRACGKIWNLLSMKGDNLSPGCPECGGELYQRDDDAELVIRNRLKVYNDQTSPLVSWYAKTGKLYTIEASASPDETLKKIQAALG